MKVLVVSVVMESDTFSPVKAGLEYFYQGYLLFGKKILSYHRGKNTEVGGFIEQAEKEKMELVPIISGYCGASGILKDETLEFLKDKILSRIKQIQNFDGILLALHGSMVAESEDDPEGVIIEKIRELAGENVPIISTFDLHGNVTNKIVNNLDGLVGYRTYPHVDFAETGKKATQIMTSILKKNVKPTMASVRVPMVLSAVNMQIKNKGPMAKIINEVKSLEQKSKVISSSVFAVQNWIDIPDMGFTAVVITDEDIDLAQREARRLAKVAWDLRNEFEVDLLYAEEAIKEALVTEGGPIILVDFADSISAGAFGDSTAILKTLIEMGVPCSVALTITDPEAVEKAIKVGVGNEITLSVGGKMDPFNKPIEIMGRVRLISDGKYVLKGPALRGVEANMGRAVVLKVMDRIDLVITEIPTCTFEPGQYRNVGVDVEDTKIVVVKAQHFFEPAYGPITRKIIIVNALGVTTPDFVSLPFKRIRRPMYPFDKKMDWQP